MRLATSQHQLSSMPTATSTSPSTVVSHAHSQFIRIRAYISRSFETPWVQNVPRSELLDDFSDWEPEVRALLQVSMATFAIHATHPRRHIQCIDTPSRWAVHTTTPLQSYVSGNVALLGDAVRPCRPHGGLHRRAHVFCRHTP